VRVDEGAHCSKRVSVHLSEPCRLQHVRLKTPDGMRGARIAFLREVSNPAEARKVLVEMVQQARSQG